MICCTKRCRTLSWEKTTSTTQEAPPPPRPPSPAAAPPQPSHPPSLLLLLDGEALLLLLFQTRAEKSQCLCRQNVEINCATRALDDQRLLAIPQPPDTHRSRPSPLKKFPLPGLLCRWRLREMGHSPEGGDNTHKGVSPTSDHHAAPAVSWLTPSFTNQVTHKGHDLVGY